MLLAGETKSSWAPEFIKSIPFQDLVRHEEKFANCDPAKGIECDEAIDALQDKMKDVHLYEGGYEYCVNKLGRPPEVCAELLNSVHVKPAFKQLEPDPEEELAPPESP